MSRLLSRVILLVALSLSCFASDETYVKGVPGAYSRLLGMEATIIELRRDGVYVITIQGCIWSEEGNGRWTVSEGILILDGRGHPKEKKDKLTKFAIVARDGDLALRPLNDLFEAEDSEAEELLFKSVKHEANQSPQPARQTDG